MLWILFIIYMGTMARLAGSGFGSKWNIPWLPEFLFSLPFGIALGWAIEPFVNIYLTVGISIIAAAISYAGMQSATWLFLGDSWEGHINPDTKRKSTLKPIVDWIADKVGYDFGDEGYSWIAAGLKGFIIGFPVGAIPLAILWPLGYEIGSHAKGRVDKYFDPHIVSEVASGMGGGIAICLFVNFVS